MTIFINIKNCFIDDNLPESVATFPYNEDCDRADARTFTNTNWQNVTWEKWQQHSGAFYQLEPAAFRYFMPSILYLSAQRPQEWFAPADSLIAILDRSPSPEYWDEFMLSRMANLADDVYEVVSEWLILLSPYEVYNWNGALERAMDTVTLLCANRST